MEPVSMTLLAIALATAAANAGNEVAKNKAAAEERKKQEKRTSLSAQQAAAAYKIPILNKTYQAPPSAYRPGVDPFISTLKTEQVGTQTSNGYVPLAPTTSSPMPDPNNPEDPGYAAGGYIPYHGGIARKVTYLRKRPPMVEISRLAKGGIVKGKGPGMADQVRARLSPGEFVVPADVVAHLGDGSSEAGGAAMRRLVEAVRKMKTGQATQPPAFSRMA